MNLSVIHLSRRSATVLFIVMVFVLSLLPIVSVITRAHAANSHANTNLSSFIIRGKPLSWVQSGPTPPTDAQCRTKFGIPCYSPQEMRNAYGLTPVLNAGFTGKGQTIIIIDSFGSPTIRRDLQTFDHGYGLPDPPSFRILAPEGTIKFDPHNSNMVGWAFETTLDVDWAHAMAPDANIVLLTSPVSETEGVQGMPEFLFLEQYALNHHLGNIISQSWGATENTLFNPGGRKVFNDFENFYKQAAAEHVTVFASAGDSGAANIDINGKFYPFPTVIFPASSPYVTAIGGTSLFADTSGSYNHETVWNNSTGATGGGLSQFFKEPDYQQNNLPNPDQKLLNGHRGLPDVAWNADPNTATLVYISFLGGTMNGFYFIGGTSEGSPQWAGVIADGNQWAGHPLGFINPAIYQLGSGSDYGESFHDITVGNNTFAGIQGYDATPGWDLTTGWGTPKVATFLQELIEIEGGTAS